MLRKIARYFKFRYFRLIVKISRRHPTKVTGLSSIQESTFDIIVALLGNYDADLLYAPVSNKFYIQKDPIFISISSSSNGCIVNISGKDIQTDATYHYDIWFNEANYNIIKNRFLKSVDKRRINVEKQILNRDKQSLNQILIDIKTNKI